METSGEAGSRPTLIDLGAGLRPRPECEPRCTGICWRGGRSFVAERDARSEMHSRWACQLPSP
jgi:hypothetical protein